jgi:hypothetical protein
MAYLLFGETNLGQRRKTPKTVLKTGKIKTSGKIVQFHHGQIFPILVPKPLFWL